MLINQIKSDIIHARKSKDSTKINLLGSLLSDCLRIGIDDGHRETTDQEVIGVIKKFEKGLHETVNLLRCNIVQSKMAIGDINLSTNENPHVVSALNEISILQSYLPTQMSREDLEDMVMSFTAQGKKMPDIMKWMKENHPGQYDSKTLVDIIKKI